MFYDKKLLNSLLYVRINMYAKEFLINYIRHLLIKMEMIFVSHEELNDPTAGKTR